MVAPLRRTGEVVGLEIEDAARNVLQFGNQLIEVGGFCIELSKPAAHLAHVSD
ncbi:hypothetical protein [Pseudomonas anguilliseptica]|uniref:hypothetical protein n=1 Tax=Pseudomonas anguilliseptica TaxID=53406 RepID=UPI00325ACC4C